MPIYYRAFTRDCVSDVLHELSEENAIGSHSSLEALWGVTVDEAVLVLA